MNAAELSLLFVGIAVIGALVLAPKEPNRHKRMQIWLALVVTTALLFVLTAVFDSLMIAADLFTYGEGTLLNIFVWLAPIEDFAYPLMTVILLPVLWLRLTTRRSVRKRVEQSLRHQAHSETSAQ